MAHCLVTGASGFVGRHLCEHLLALGMQVTGMDVRPLSQLTSRAVNNVHGDLATGEGVDDLAWDSFDVVFHLAAAGVKSVSREWQTCLQVNLLGTLRLIECLESAARVPALVYTHTFYEDFIESAPSLRSSPYVMSKYATTQVVRQLARYYPGSVTMAKVFQIYGDGDAPSNLIPYVLSCLKRGESALLGSGAGLRDWLDVDDVAAGLVACWQTGVPGKLQEFDLGSGTLMSVKDVLLSLARTLGAPTELLKFDASRDRGDIMAAGKAVRWPTNWSPQYDLESGLRRLCRI